MRTVLGSRLRLFAVDGALCDTRASNKSYQRGDFKGENRYHDMHESATDPEVRLFRKGKQRKAGLRFVRELQAGGRHSLVIHVELTETVG
ncbi:MAG: hypothetical protein F4W96_09805 [Chloroflexi bacterium]|nr:hypothetical protein [Chloroflexota bacterium]